MTTRSLRLALADRWGNSWAAFHNWRIRNQPAPADYVLLNVSGDLPEYIAPPPRWQKWLPFALPGGASGPSLNGLRSLFERIGQDPRPMGVILNLNVSVGWATAQSLRNAITRLRAQGKTVVVYAQHFDVGHYFIAAAANKIIAPRPAMWAVNGLRTELTFLKDALGAWGIETEVVNVSPYKTAGDTFARADISPEHRAMTDWLMDGRYDLLIEAIAAGRSLSPVAVQTLIDEAPLSATIAKERGLIDAVLYEDELAEYLGPQQTEPKRIQKSRGLKWPFSKKAPSEETAQTPKANIKHWHEVAQWLQRPIRWRSGKSIAVISVEGTIIPGHTPQIPSLPIPIPMVGETMAGSDTVSQHLREAEKNDKVAAVVLYVDSRGGSALASDLIGREVERLRRKKPVVVYMGNFAASGGYYVSALAHHIVAQPLTITGSIGVITLKLVTAGLYNLFQANRVVIQRGAHASLFADDAPFTPQLRAAAQAQTDTFYTDFKHIVTQGRGIEEPQLEDIAGGRVWLGTQALERKLVDTLGDLTVAIDKAKELAKLPSDKYTPTAWFSGTGGNLMPPPFGPAPASITDYLKLTRTLLRERLWMILPFKMD